jgi:UDP-glucose 4-epimerase
MNILLTGGLGYIGSHTALRLLELDYNLIIVDNLSNSNIKTLEFIKLISGRSVFFYEKDIADYDGLLEIFRSFKIDAAFHFAGLKSVNDSVINPLKYYRGNVYSSLVLFELLVQNNVKNIIFSSSATVYGEPSYLPINEDHKTEPYNPYGRTKLIIENIGKDMCNTNTDINFISLRYFNPIGSHKSGLIGESFNNDVNNLMPHIIRTYLGLSECLLVYGTDYKTHDGTAIRDYIHIDDLVEGHITALKKTNVLSGYNSFNLGTGKGYSVLDLIKTFQDVSNKKIPYKFTHRRQGDLPVLYSDTNKANNILNWRAQNDLKKMCESTLKWLNNLEDLM